VDQQENNNKYINNNNIIIIIIIIISNIVGLGWYITKRRKMTISKVVVRFCDINDDKVHVQTGFRSLLCMLAYIAIVSNGDIKKIQSSSTILTWFEEWYLFFEVMYSRSVSRWVDVQYKYHVSDVTVRKIYDKKLDEALALRLRWPRFASFEEDKTYRKQEEKWEAYKGKRVIMYDNTNVRMKQPSDAEAQRATYSMYYSGNVGKGAVHIQPCGWMGCNELWSGGVSDTAYMQEEDVFPDLNKYLLTSPLETEEIRNIKFTIILNRGYRVTIDALNTGGHYVLQPIFASPDEQFSTEEVHVSSTVATDCSGNERAVKYSKISDYINKGLQCNESTERLGKTWLAWGFQVNFMYLPVH
jgi:hypothetical protein